MPASSLINTESGSDARNPLRVADQSEEKDFIRCDSMVDNIGRTEPLDSARGVMGFGAAPGRGKALDALSRLE